MTLILKLVGYWPPVVYGVVVFYAFWLLDRKAAPRARRAISSWFAGPKYDERDVAAAVVYVFDSFYTTPLSGWHAALRSATISVTVTIVVSLQIDRAVPYLLFYGPKELWVTAFSQLLTNVAADYFSLFIIRRWLILGGLKPLFALSTAPLIAVAIVTVCYLALDVARFSLMTFTFDWSYFLSDLLNWRAFIFNQGLRWALLVPAFLVHLWLPLFALGILVAKAINSIRLTGRFSQWYFVQGEAHPLRSIGYIASGISALLTAVLMFLRP